MLAGARLNAGDRLGWDTRLLGLVFTGGFAIDCGHGGYPHLRVEVRGGWSKKVLQRIVGLATGSQALNEGRLGPLCGGLVDQSGGLAEQGGEGLSGIEDALESPGSAFQVFAGLDSAHNVQGRQIVARVMRTSARCRARAYE